MALFATLEAAEAAGYVRARGYRRDIMGARLLAHSWYLSLLPVYAEDREVMLSDLDVWPARLGRVEQVLLTDEINAANQPGCYVRMLSPDTIQRAIHEATRAMTAVRRLVPSETLGTIAKQHSQADADQAQHEERALLSRAMQLGIADMAVIERPVGPDGRPATMMDYGALCGRQRRRPAQQQHLRNAELLRSFLRHASV